MKSLLICTVIIAMLSALLLSCGKQDAPARPRNPPPITEKLGPLEWLDTLDSAAIASKFGWDSQCDKFESPEDFEYSLLLGRDRGGNPYSPMTWPIELVGDNASVLDTLLRNYMLYYFASPSKGNAAFSYLQSPNLKENYLMFGETVGAMAMVMVGRSHQASDGCDLYHPHEIFFMLSNRIFFPNLDLARTVLYKKFGILFRNFHGKSANDFKPGGVAQVSDSIWLKMDGGENEER